MKSYGPYIVLDTLGKGGMGTVFRGRHKETDDIVAIKVLSKQFSGNDHFRIRFNAEIETLFKLNHPNIVRLISWGQNKGELFFAMELVEGRSLYAEQKLKKRFHWRDVILMSLDICEGLRHAHDRGVKHRDIKPGNLLLRTDGVVKITDFGIAKLFDGAHVTVDGGVVGTADFMSPEQATGGPITQRSDLYSVGCVMYSLLASRPPLASKSIHEAIHNLTSKKPPKVSQHAPGVPEKLVQLVARLLEKDPEDRIGSALALSRRLKEILEEAESQAEAATQSAAPQSASPQPAAPQPAAPLQDFDMADEMPNRSTAKTNVDHGGETNSPSKSEEPSESRNKKTKISVDHVAGGGATVASEDGLTRQSHAEATVHLTGDEKSQAIQRSRAKASGSAATAADAPLAPAESLVIQPPNDDDAPEMQLESDGSDTLQNTDRRSYYTEIRKDRKQIQGPEIAESVVTGPVWPYLLALLTVLGMAVAGIWMVIQQAPGKDDLYERIVVNSADPSSVRKEMKEFIGKYPGDDRVGEIKRLLDQANSGKQLRKIELKARIRGATALLPIESAFVDAMQQRKSDPVGALEKLRGVAKMYDSHQDKLPDSGEECLQAIRGQINQLVPLVERFKTRHREAIETILDSSLDLEKSDLSSAIRSYEGILINYHDKSWAQDLMVVTRVRLDDARKQAELAAEPLENEENEEANPEKSQADADADETPAEPLLETPEEDD